MTMPRAGSGGQVRNEGAVALDESEGKAGGPRPTTAVVRGAGDGGTEL